MERQCWNLAIKHVLLNIAPNAPNRLRKNNAAHVRAVRLADRVEGGSSSKHAVRTSGPCVGALHLVWRISGAEKPQFGLTTSRSYYKQRIGSRFRRFWALAMPSLHPKHELVCRSGYKPSFPEKDPVGPTRAEGKKMSSISVFTVPLRKIACCVLNT